MTVRRRTLSRQCLMLLVVMALVGLIAFHEFDTIAGAQGIAKSGYAGMAAGLVLLFAPEPVWVTIVLLALALMALELRQLDLSKSMTGAATALLGIVYIFGAWRCALGLRQINPPFGPHWLMIALLVPRVVGMDSAVRLSQLARDFFPDRRMGGHVGESLVRRARAKPPKPFQFKDAGYIISLGKHSSVLDLFGVPLSGKLAWLLWAGAYLVKMVGLRKQIEVGIDHLTHLWFEHDTSQILNRRAVLTDDELNLALAQDEPKSEPAPEPAQAPPREAAR